MSLDKNIDEKIRQDLLANAYSTLPNVLVVFTATSAVVAMILARSYPLLACLWIGVVLASTPFRLLTLTAFNRIWSEKNSLTPSEFKRFTAYYKYPLYFSGVMWALAVMLAVHTDRVDKFTIVTIVSALAAGASAVVASMLKEGRTYIILLLLPGAIAMMIDGGDLVKIGWLGIVFVGVMISGQYKNHMILRRSFELQHENDALVDNLQELNGQLESKVAERTDALKKVAYRDTLTGLPNRLGLMDWMKANLSTDNKDEAAVMFLDLDRFKQINDAMGHDVGDQVLKVTACRLSECLPDGSILARWGGDEFIIVTKQSKLVRKIVQRVSRELLSAVSLPFEAEGQSLGLGLSIGTAFFPTDASTHKDAILAADLAVAEVKRTGRGHFLNYSETYAETQRRKFDLSRELGEAIKHDSLSLHYQPIVQASSGNIYAREALVRWNHPALGPINPEEFVKLAEDTDRIVALGDWVLSRACSDAAKWESCEEKPAPQVAVNVSVKQLLSEGYALRVMQILAQSGLPPGRLELEVTESLFDDENMDVVLAAVTNLRAMGVAVHIDDFGTGYSSLSRLHQFPVTAIKIDRSFVAQMDGQGGVIIESAMLIAKHFGFAVVAEGVETEEQAKRLSELGVDYLQGFYFGRPEKEIYKDTEPQRLDAALKRAASA